jgi:ankyrin repeat protein
MLSAKYVRGLILAVATAGAVSVAGGLPLAAADDSRLARAARRDDLAGVRALLRAGADVNGREGDGSTPLLWATYQSNPEMVRLLLAARADVTLGNRYGLTPLLQAARVGHTGIVQALLEAGARLDVTQPEGETVLMAAAAAGSVDTVRLFLARGVPVNAQETAAGQTALMWAAGEGHAPVVRALLEAGADPNVVGRTSALTRGRGDGGRMWVDFTSGGLTAAMFAARSGRVEVIRTLAEHGADLNRANPDGLTPLLIAVINDHTDAAAELLARGARPDAGAMYETVSLHNLRTNETVGEATRPRPWNRNVVSPLELLAQMLDRGGDPMALSEHTLHADTTGQPEPANQSAFGRALQAQDVGALKVMIARGANVNLMGPAGAPLMSLMGGGGRFGGGFGAQPAAFRHPGVRSAPEAARLLIDAGADVNAQRQNGDTALHLAAAAGNVAMIQLLADNGAKLDVRNAAGYTPLDAAMGRQAPGAAGPPRGGGPGRGGAPQPQPQAISLLRTLMGLPDEPQSTPAGARGGA